MRIGKGTKLAIIIGLQLTFITAFFISGHALFPKTVSRSLNFSAEEMRPPYNVFVPTAVEATTPDEAVTKMLKGPVLIMNASIGTLEKDGMTIKLATNLEDPKAPLAYLFFMKQLPEELKDLPHETHPITVKGEKTQVIVTALRAAELLKNKAIFPFVFKKANRLNIETWVRNIPQIADTLGKAGQPSNDIVDSALEVAKGEGTKEFPSAGPFVNLADLEFLSPQDELIVSSENIRADMIQLEGMSKTGKPVDEVNRALATAKTSILPHSLLEARTIDNRVIYLAIARMGVEATLVPLYITAEEEEGIAYFYQQEEGISVAALKQLPENIIPLLAFAGVPEETLLAYAALPELQTEFLGREVVLTEPGVLAERVYHLLKEAVTTTSIPKPGYVSRLAVPTEVTAEISPIQQALLNLIAGLSSEEILSSNEIPIQKLKPALLEELGPNVPVYEGNIPSERLINFISRKVIRGKIEVLSSEAVLGEKAKGELPFEAHYSPERRDIHIFETAKNPTQALFRALLAAYAREYGVVFLTPQRINEIAEGVASRIASIPMELQEASALEIARQRLLVPIITTLPAALTVKSFPTFSKGANPAQPVTLLQRAREVLSSEVTQEIDVAKTTLQQIEASEASLIAAAEAPIAEEATPLLQESIEGLRKALESLKMVSPGAVVKPESLPELGKFLKASIKVMEDTTIGITKEAKLERRLGTIIWDDTGLPKDQLLLLQKSNPLNARLKEALGSNVVLLSELAGEDLSKNMIVVTNRKFDEILSQDDRIKGARTLQVNYQAGFLPVSPLTTFAKGLLVYAEDKTSAVTIALQEIYRAITGIRLEDISLLNASVFIIEQLPQPIAIDQSQYEELHRRALLALIAV